jgi:hypothetical protein
MSEYSKVGIDFVITKSTTTETKIISKEKTANEHHHDGADTCMLHGCKGDSKLNSI